MGRIAYPTAAWQLEFDASNFVSTKARDTIKLHYNIFRNYISEAQPHSFDINIFTK